MKVASWQDTLTLKTYLRGPDNVNHSFQQSIYPYPAQDDLTHETEEKEYIALHLENQYMHLIVLPELGGHVHSAYDKVAGQEMFYRNNVVKFGLVALRGAWISGGIEFNFFQIGHSTTTVSPVSWEMKESNEASGGRASITISNIDLTSRARWAVTLSLYPDDSRIHQQVIVYNRMPVRQKYYVWSNATAAATDDLHLVFPAHKVQLSSDGIVDYPIWKGKDISWYRNYERPNDIFTLDTENFFGGYHTQQDAGVVHIADHAECVGKKFFTWGTADDGMIWVDLLTDADGQYVELQSGRLVDMGTYEFMKPFQKFSWTEYWWPVHGIGDYVWATEEAALNFHLSDDRMQVGAITCRPHPNAELRVMAQGRTLWHEQIPLGPEVPFNDVFPLPDIEPGEEVTVTISAEGRELLRYEYPPAYTRQPSVTVTGERDQPKPKAEEECSAEELCLRATDYERHGKLDKSCGLYEKALSIDSGFSHAHMGLGLLDYSAGRYESAHEHFRQAVERNPEDYEARYYLAFAKKLTGDMNGACEILRRLIACGRQVEEATELLRQIEITVGLIPASESELAAPHLLRDDPEQWLEVATEYADLRSWDKAIDLLRAGCSQFESVERNALIHYSLAYYLSNAGVEHGASQQEYEKAAVCDLDYCFPWRLETIPVLQAAIEYNADDWKAKYLLGTLLAARGRHAEALQLWFAAATIDDSYSVLCRNVGFGLWQWHNEKDEAIAWYYKAIAIRPNDYHLYVELVQLLRADERSAEERLALLRSAPPLIQDKWQIAKYLAATLVELERWDEALQELQNHHFPPWEGERDVRKIWVAALLGRAGAAEEAGDLDAALADCELALHYPRNLGVGKLAHPQKEDARIYLQAAQVAGKLGDLRKQEQYLHIATTETYTTDEALYVPPA